MAWMDFSSRMNGAVSTYTLLTKMFLFWKENMQEREKENLFIEEM